MMKTSKMHKRIMRGLIFIIVLSLIAFVPKVNADTKYCKDADLKEGETREYASDILYERYGIEIADLGDNKYEISMNPKGTKEEKEKRCKKTLKVAKINNTKVDADLKCDKPYKFTVDVNDKNNKTESGIPGFSVLITGSNIKSKEKDDNSCVYKEAKLVIEMSAVQKVEVESETCSTVELEIPNYNSSTIDCNNTGGSKFKEAFCKTKEKALAAHHDKSGKVSTNDFTDDGKFTGTLSAGNTYCNPDLSEAGAKAAIPLESYKLTEENYFSEANTNYFYASATKTYPMGNYEYNYAVDYCVYGEEISCEVTCEEALEVQYGPPVASFAGMCFEYNVRVTSRVACEVTGPPDAPKPNCYYDEAYPKCVTASGAVFRQGGPNEEFDACIKSCDGGKYSASCSRSCYKQVYGVNITAGAAVNNSFYEQVQGTRLATKGSSCTGIDIDKCKEITGNDGCYARESGTIVWKPAYTPGRWYSLGMWSPCNPANEYDPDYTGIYRHDLGNGNHCSDTCYWVYSWGRYLNPKVADWDYVRNVDKYNKAVKACNNMASCSTTDASFTIRAEYTKKGKSTPTKVKFPYNGQTDWIKREGTKVTTTADQANTTLRPDFEADGSGIQGCYKNGDTSTTLYRSTWGFPGSWKNMKTNEIAYVKSDKNDAWKSFPNNFCVPNDAQDVNDKWFFAYYNRLLYMNNLFEEMEISSTSRYHTQNYQSGVSSYAGTKQDDGSYDGITYNIIARTEGFGYFNWKLNINCFFAIGTDTDCGDNCPGGGLNYTIRSVDQKDLFPDKDGSEHSADKSGRTPEFNWSSHANQTEKNSGYKSEPNTYMKAIQNYARANADSLYNDSNLDYEFYLSPDTLKSMRKDKWGSGGANYTEFKDKDFYLDENGVGRYYSYAIRDLGNDSDRKVPKRWENKDDALRCNNMVNYNSTSCCVSWNSSTGECIAG